MSCDFKEEIQIQNILFKKKKKSYDRVLYRRPDNLKFEHFFQGLDMSYIYTKFAIYICSVEKSLTPNV